MEKKNEHPCLLEAALRYASMDCTCIPIASGKKAPPLLQWKRYQTEAPTVDNYRSWFDDDARNIAILTGEIIVADVDDPALLDFVVEKCGETKVISKTPSGGFHLWYRRRRGTHVGNRVHVRGRDFDLRAKGVTYSCRHRKPQSGDTSGLAKGLCPYRACRHSGPHGPINEQGGRPPRFCRKAKVATETLRTQRRIAYTSNQFRGKTEARASCTLSACYATQEDRARKYLIFSSMCGTHGAPSPSGQSGRFYTQ